MKMICTNSKCRFFYTEKGIGKYHCVTHEYTISCNGSCYYGGSCIHHDLKYCMKEVLKKDEE